MNYQQFVTNVRERLSLSLDCGMSVELHTTLKNNGKERIGLTISDKRTNIFPTIYLEEYYQQFQKGNSIDAIVDNILQVYREVKFEQVWQTNAIKAFPSIQKKIVYKLIHAGKNKRLLEGMPFIPYLDLAIVFYVLFRVDESGIATIPITNELAHFWNTNAQELYHLAKNNAKELLPASFKPIHVVIEELMGRPYEEGMPATDIMYILTNSLRTFGAASMLYEEVLEQIAGQLGESFFILPSSIHELIIIPESQSPSREHLSDMVIDVNETQTDIEEILSDHAYYYNHCTLTLC